MACGRVSERAPRAIIVACLVLLSLACAHPPPTALRPGPFEPLTPDEGILVVQLDLGIAVQEIEAEGTVIARDLQPGQHLWVVKMKAGRYRWTSVRLMSAVRNGSRIRPMPVGVSNEREFVFDVEAGKVNYPGEFLVRLNDPIAGVALGVVIRNRNHSAMAFRKLLAPIRSCWRPIRSIMPDTSDDEFLDFYTRSAIAWTIGAESNRCVGRTDAEVAE